MKQVATFFGAEIPVEVTEILRRFNNLDPDSGSRFTLTQIIIFLTLVVNALLSLQSYYARCFGLAWCWGAMATALSGLLFLSIRITNQAQVMKFYHILFLCGFLQVAYLQFVQDARTLLMATVAGLVPALSLFAFEPRVGFRWTFMFMMMIIIGDDRVGPLWVDTPTAKWICGLGLSSVWLILLGLSTYYKSTEDYLDATFESMELGINTAQILAMARTEEPSCGITFHECIKSV